MTGEGTILVADTGSTNGTYINGRRIAYGESRPVEEGDVLGFGDIEVRLRRND
jgi:pSer/pThr/pTyr-binding forkhead associated (FHA) protein